MRVLPIVQRELRVAARRRSTYGLRLVAALPALLIILWLCAWPIRGQPPPALGQSLFSALTSLAFAYGLLIGPFLTADSISAEKRDGTLGLLFLTDLGSPDVVFGKWAASSLTGLYGLLAVLPSLGIPLLLGGVTRDEYGRIALAVVNAILFSLTAGMFTSAVSRDPTKAVLASLILVLALTGLLPGLTALLLTGFWSRGAWGYPPMSLASPIFTGQFAMDIVFKSNPRLFWFSLGTVHLLCWSFMIGTIAIVARVWRQEPVEPVARHRWMLRLGRTARWQRRLRRRLEKNPIDAVASRHRWPHWVFWSLVVIVAINIHWLTIGYRQNPGIYPFHQHFSEAMVFINRVWLAAMACRFFVEARRTGALELLLTTPISDRTLRRGRRRALIRLFFWPVLAIALLHWAFIWGSWKPYAQQPAGPIMLRQVTLMAAGSLASFLTDVLALTAVGGWFSLSSGNVRMVVLKTFVWVILVPWVLVYLTRSAGRIPAASPDLYILIVPILMVTKNLSFLGWASYKMKRHFRAAASQTYRLKHRKTT